MTTTNGFFASAMAPGSIKRKMSDSDEHIELEKLPHAKRSRVDYRVATPPDTPPAPSSSQYFAPPSPCPTVQDSHDESHGIADVINEQLGREILERHQELRFINQELAKCMSARDQLRRCHLIPYPTNCPTPQQMLDIIDGKVPALRSEAAADPAPKWAPPYGVVDGPYARHYAKWLIPDPRFDGPVPEWLPAPVAAMSPDNRATRHTIGNSEGVTIGQRVARGQISQKQSSLIATEKKAKKPPAGPAFMKRDDGVTVKLVCCFCKRDTFSNVQGFINHVRIAHQTPLESHKDAARRCGVPVDESELAAITWPVVEEKKPNTAAPPSQAPTSTVHPLVTPSSQTLSHLQQKANSSLNKLPNGCMPLARIPGDFPELHSKVLDSWTSNSFVGSSATPSLSIFMQKQGYEGDLSARVEDAKIKADPVNDDEDEQDEDEDDGDVQNEQPELGRHHPGQTAVMRPTMAPVSEQRSSSGRGRSIHLSLDPTAPGLRCVTSSRNDQDALSDFGANMMDSEHSPTTATSNNEPPLVSDDGGDESDDAASSSDTTEVMEQGIAEVDPEHHDDYLAHRAAGTHHAHCDQHSATQ